MPGWHERTKELQSEGRIQMLGIIQEQHPDRALLFMQWKRMGWPLLVDSMNLLGVKVVPITALIDASGVVRALNPKPEDLAEFLEENPASLPSAADRSDVGTVRRTLVQGAEASLEMADGFVLWEDESRLDVAISIYRKLLAEEKDGSIHFRLGTALRKRYDSEFRQADDFAQAVSHWARALSIDPNQYIWRRRIQQYGPRLDKPYPFYDWVPEAIGEIRQRGEEPLELAVQPSGAEFAHPIARFAGDDGRGEPDPEGRIWRDSEGFVLLETTVVPPRPEPGKSARVHLVFRPNQKIKAHWNNEADDMVVWVDAPSGWSVNPRKSTVARPPATVSLEPRHVEFEVNLGAEAKGGVEIPAYALYYVCEDVDGTCLYRRQDLKIEIEVGG